MPDTTTNAAPDALDDLLNDLATDGGAPKPFTYAGKRYAVRTRYTGAEVLALSKKLIFTPPEPEIAGAEFASLSIVDRIAAQQLHKDAVEAAYNHWMIDQLSAVLTEGDAEQLWAAIGPLPANVSTKLVRGILQRTGLVNQLGEFLAP